MLLTYTVPIEISRGDTVATVADVPITGYLKGVSVTAGTMQDGSTYTVAVNDKHGNAVYSKGSLAPSQTTTNWSDLYGGATPVAPLALPLVGPIDVVITASKAQNNADVSFVGFISVPGAKNPSAVRACLSLSSL